MAFGQVDVGDAQLEFEHFDEALFIQVTQLDQGRAEALAGLFLPLQAFVELIDVDIAGLDQEFTQPALDSSNHPDTT